MVNLMPSRAKFRDDRLVILPREKISTSQNQKKQQRNTAKIKKHNRHQHNTDDGGQAMGEELIHVQMMYINSSPIPLLSTSQNLRKRSFYSKNLQQTLQ